MLSVFAVAVALVAGSVVAADAGTDARIDTEVPTDDSIELIDESGELTPSERETARTLVSNDDEAMDELRARVGEADALTLEVHGVSPDEKVHLAVSASGENPETAVVVDLDDETVEVEDTVLLGTADAENVSLEADEDWNVTVVDG